MENRPKLPTKSSLIRSNSSSMASKRSNTSSSSQQAKRPSLGAMDEETPASIFGPWRSLSSRNDESGDDNAPDLQDQDDTEEEGSLTTGKKKNLTWTPNMDDNLVDLLLEQMEKGQKIGSTFTNTAFVTVARSISNKFSLAISTDNIKNRIKTLRKKYAVAQTLLNESGFGYNETTEMVEATPEVWKSYIEAKPDASTYRYKPIRNLYKLDILFGKDRATGSRSGGPKQRMRQLVEKEGSSTNHDNSTSNQAQEDLPSHEVTSSHQSTLFKETKERKKLKTTVADKVCEEVRSIRSSIEAVATALERGNLRNYTEEHLYEEIMKVDGLNEVSQMKVYQELSADPNSARAFLACPIERRGLWLKVKYGLN